MAAGRWSGAGGGGVSVLHTPVNRPVRMPSGLTVPQWLRVQAAGGNSLTLDAAKMRDLAASMEAPDASAEMVTRKSLSALKRSQRCLLASVVVFVASVALHLIGALL